MLTLVLILAFVALVVWLATRQRRVRASTCCSSGAWPPDDLVLDRAYRDGAGD